MTKVEKVADILKILDKHFPTVEVPLHHKDAYTLLVSVLLSAQCTDERVNKITPLLFRQADNPYDMVKLTIEEIREIIRPCGLSPMKSKGIYGLSKILIEKYKRDRRASKTARGGERASATVNRELELLSKVFSLAIDQGLSIPNPCRRSKTVS